MGKTILYKIKAAFHDLGIRLVSNGSFYEFEYGHIPMLLSIDLKEHSVAFITHVVDSSDNSMDESVLNLALDVVEEFHKDCYGDWNEGVPYFMSPCYSLKRVGNISAEWLKEQLKEFYDTFIFLEANIHLLCDSSICGATDG